VETIPHNTIGLQQKPPPTTATGGEFENTAESEEVARTTATARPPASLGQPGVSTAQLEQKIAELERSQGALGRILEEARKNATILQQEVEEYQEKMKLVEGKWRAECNARNSTEERMKVVEENWKAECDARNATEERLEEVLEELLEERKKSAERIRNTTADLALLQDELEKTRGLLEDMNQSEELEEVYKKLDDLEEQYRMALEEISRLEEDRKHMVSRAAASHGSSSSYHHSSSSSFLVRVMRSYVKGMFHPQRPHGPSPEQVEIAKLNR